MTVRIPVKQNVLTWAIERAGYAVEPFLAEVPQAAKWVQGEKEPTLKQLENFAKKLHVPFGFLLLDEPPKEAIVPPLFRTIDAAGGLPPTVRDTIVLLRQRQDWLSDFLRDNGHDALPFVGSAAQTDNPVELAGRMRGLLGLPANQPIRRGKAGDTLRLLADTLDEVGIHVFISGVDGNNNRRPIPVENCRGFVLLDDFAPFVFVNNQDAKAAQLFTLAHEFAHVLVGREGLLQLDQLLPAEDPIERLCDAAAAEFLVPAALLPQVFVEAGEDVDKTARVFGVSPIVIGRRLLDLGQWDRSTFFAFYATQRAKWDALRAKQKEVDGGNFYATKAQKVGRRFLQYVDQAARSGSLPYRQAYRLTGTTRKSFTQLVEKSQPTDG